MLSRNREDLTPERGRFVLELGQGLGKTVLDLYRPSDQRPPQLVVVVAHHREARPGRLARHRDPEHLRDARPAINQVADEDDAPAVRMAEDVIVAHLVAEQRDELPQLVDAAVDVADQVERAAVVARADRSGHRAKDAVPA